MKPWQEAALRYSAQGLNSTEISKAIEKDLGESVKIGTVRHFLWRDKKKTKDLPNKAPKKEKRVVIQNLEPEYHDGKWDGTETIRFAIMGDTQFGSKYAQMTHLHNFYDLCAKQGITDVYHTGDITDGVKMRPGHEYELYEHSADGQLDLVAKYYPKREGITTHFITGNHDASLYKHVGYDIGRAIARERSDMEYLGRDCAVINITPNCTLELRHPWDGCSYAISYRLQKMIEAMDSDSKPSILAVGHYHKQIDMYYRDIHAMITGSFQAQTPFMRGKSIASILGGYIVTIRVDKDGIIQGFTPDFIPYKPIKEDWKNYLR